MGNYPGVKPEVKESNLHIDKSFWLPCGEGNENGVRKEFCSSIMIALLESGREMVVV